MSKAVTAPPLSRVPPGSVTPKTRIQTLLTWALNPKPRLKDHLPRGVSAGGGSLQSPVIRSVVEELCLGFHGESNGKNRHGPRSAHWCYLGVIW